jgi:hypothetical protein
MALPSGVARRQVEASASAVWIEPDEKQRVGRETLALASGVNPQAHRRMGRPDLDDRNVAPERSLPPHQTQEDRNRLLRLAPCASGGAAIAAHVPNAWHSSASALLTTATTYFVTRSLAWLGLAA